MGWIAAFKAQGNIMGFHELPKKSAAKRAPNETARKKRKK